MGELRKWVALLVVGAVLWGLTGCGGGGGDETLTKAQFEQQAKLICNKGQQEREEAIHAQLQKLEEGESKQATAAMQEAAVLAVLDSYDRMTAKLADVGLPEGDEAQVEKIVDSMETAAAQVRANPQSAAGSGAPFKEADELLKAYGLESCVV